MPAGAGSRRIRRHVIALHNAGKRFIYMEGGYDAAGSSENHMEGRMAFTKILLPVDGSDPAKNACGLAMDLARTYKAEIHLMHCYKDIPATIGGHAREELSREEIAAAEEIIEEPFRRIKHAGIICVSHVTRGNPAQCIVKAAHDNGCDLIVMGSRGLGCLETLMVGSVSQNVLKMSLVPVMLTH